jgi:hypothetical protein
VLVIAPADYRDALLYMPMQYTCAPTALWPVVMPCALLPTLSSTFVVAPLTDA